MKDCPQCDGTGYLLGHGLCGGYLYETERECPKCGGSGEVELRVGDYTGIVDANGEPVRVGDMLDLRDGDLYLDNKTETKNTKEGTKK